MDAAGYVGTVCEGVFKSFSAEKGWGFLNSELFPDVDVFVSFSTAPQLRQAAISLGELQGVPATFELCESAKKPGSYEAKQVTVSVMEEEEVSADPSSLIGQTLRGTIKSFNAQKRWGFITCPQVSVDVFLSANLCPEVKNAALVADITGQPVTFELHESKSNPGSFEAREAKFKLGKGKGGGKKGGSVNGAGLSQALAMLTGQIAQQTKQAKGGFKRGTPNLQGQQCVGHIKSFSSQTGWGFITCDGFADDVFVSFKTCPELKALAMAGPIEGLRVSFVLSQSASTPGRYEARNLRFIDGRAKGGGKQAGKPKTVHAPTSATIDHWFKGTFKSFSASRGWGFIVSAEMPSDVFVSFNSCPDVQNIVASKDDVAGMAVSFQVAASKSTPGRFEATSVREESAGFGPANKPSRKKASPY